MRHTCTVTTTQVVSCKSTYHILNTVMCMHVNGHRPVISLSHVRKSYHVNHAFEVLFRKIMIITHQEGRGWAGAVLALFCSARCKSVHNLVIHFLLMINATMLISISIAHSSFQCSAVKPVITLPHHKGHNPVNQPELEANTCGLHKVQENTCKLVSYKYWCKRKAQ